MKKKRLTPEEFGCSISDPDFLNGDGELITTHDREGRVKHLGSGYFIRYHLDDEERYASLDLTLYNKKCMISYITFLRFKDTESAEDSVYWINDSGNADFIKNKIQVDKKNFIDFILNDHPDAGEWVLWNI